MSSMSERAVNKNGPTDKKVRPDKRWLGYFLGVCAGALLGYWAHDFWEGDLTGVGAGPPPSLDLYVSVAALVLSVVALAFIKRR
jgi:hypothetical protein